MCAIVGVKLNDVTDEDISFVTTIIFEARIRGMHATGVTYLQDGQLKTIKMPLSAGEFLLKNPVKSMLNGKDLTMIAHCRYSTSDIEYNQPFDNGEVGLAHNGVISQELPENWETLYGYKTETKNDSELLLHTIAEGKAPFSTWPDASISAVEVYKTDKLRFYRNGKRPLHLTSRNNGSIITSTADIFWRAGVTSPVVSVTPGTYFTLEEDAMLCETDKVIINDLQDLSYRQSV